MANSFEFRPKTAKSWSIQNNKGLAWSVRCSGNSNYGKFLDLMDNGNELLATTEKGLFYSKNKGLSWNVRKRD